MLELLTEMHCKIILLSIFADDLNILVLLLKIILLHFERKIVQMSDNIEKKKKWPPHFASWSKFVMAARKISFTDYYFGQMY